MKNTLKLLTALAVITLTLTACSGSDGSKDSPKTIDIPATMNSIVETAKFEDELIKLTEKNVADYYEIDSNMVSEYEIRVSATGGTAEELAIFKLANSDTKTSDAVEEMINNRKASLKKSFADYIPAEVARIETAIVSKKDGYIMFSISNDVETVKKAFEDALK